MAVDKKNEDLVLERLSFMDDEIDKMDTLSGVQEEVFESLKILVFKELDVDKDGNIKRTRKNQKAAQKFSKIRNVVLNQEYKQKVSGFIGAFGIVKDMSDKQITEI